MNVLTTHHRLPVFKFDTPTLNGRIYPNHLFKKFKKGMIIEGYFFPHLDSYSNNPPKEYLAFEVTNFEKDDEHIMYADITVFENKNLEPLLEHYMNNIDNFVFRPSGFGVVDSGIVGDDYDPKFFILSPKSHDSFIQIP